MVERTNPARNNYGVSSTAIAATQGAARQLRASHPRFPIEGKIGCTGIH